MTQDIDNFNVNAAVRSAVAVAQYEPIKPDSRYDALSATSLRYVQGKARLQLSDPKQQAEGYALMGEYEKAIELDPHNQEYIAILEAINHSNESTCDCPQIIGQGPNRIETRFIKEKFFRHGVERLLYCCSSCGHLNVI